MSAPQWPEGPALVYVPSPQAALVPEEGPVAYRVDIGRPISGGGPLSDDDARRERKLLRALLNQALWLLGDEEHEG